MLNRILRRNFNTSQYLSDASNRHELKATLFTLFLWTMLGSAGLQMARIKQLHADEREKINLELLQLQDRINQLQTSPEPETKPEQEGITLS
jgi:hypothetical protein